MAIKLFESHRVRSIWGEEEEKCYFSIVDVIEVLTGSDRPRKYWSDLKTKLKKEASEVSEKIGQLKMESPDNKMISRQGGIIAGNTRKAIEEKSGKKIVTPQNAKTLKSGPANQQLE